MRLSLIVLFFIPILVLAQDTIAYSEFRFTIVDVQGKDLTDDKLQARVAEVFLTDTSKRDLDYVFTQLEYSKKDSCWILRQTEPKGYSYKIELNRKSDTVNLRLLELRKMTIIYTGYDPENKIGCQYCICNDIPYEKGVFTIDMPRKMESWLYIRKVAINIKSIPTDFRDITAIQNWFFRNGK